MKKQTYSYYTDHGYLITVHACSNCGTFPTPQYMGKYKIALVCEECGKHTIESTIGNGYHEWNRINPIEQSNQ